MRDHLDSSEATAASRQAAWIFVLAGLFTLTALPSSPVADEKILAVAIAHIVAAALGRAAPWHRWGLASTAVLGLIALLLLSATTWAFDGFASGLGPMFVLVFAWLGLHHSVPVILGAIPVAALGYATALLAADARPRLVLSTLILIPIAAVVSLLIARRVRELKLAHQALEVKERWRAALMSTLAHDVRSPLSSVTGALEILEDDPATNPQHQGLIAAATRQANRVLRLATGILELERSEQGKLRLDCRHLNLASLADEVAALSRRDQVEVDIDPAMVIRADAQRLEQILFNLTSNALRHGEPPVVIGAAQSGDHVEIWVRDHGDGVPEGDVGYLFDRFSSDDRSPNSVGLGLWIVKLLADSHGGAVRYEPAEPGARFIITLPDTAMEHFTTLV